MHTERSFEMCEGCMVMKKCGLETAGCFLGIVDELRGLRGF